LHRSGEKIEKTQREISETAMKITQEIIRKSVSQQKFGDFEPFISGEDRAIASFYQGVITGLENLPGVGLFREHDHHGSGYASYVSVFLYPEEGHYSGAGVAQHDYPEFVHTTGILLYLSRLAPIAVYGASNRTDNKHDGGGSGGFIEASNVGLLPDGDWSEFLGVIEECLQSFRIEILPREPLLLPAPQDISIPTVFDGPYYVFDTLFYWED
jgi:hypothetical protein